MSERCFGQYVWNRIHGELQSGGVASAVHQLWQLRRHSPQCWQDFAYEVNHLDLTDRQYRLVASLWELSRERHLEDIAPRLRTLPDSLCNSFR